MEVVHFAICMLTSNIDVLKVPAMRQLEVVFFVICNIEVPKIPAMRGGATFLNHGNSGNLPGKKLSNSHLAFYLLFS